MLALLLLGGAAVGGYVVLTARDDGDSPAGVVRRWIRAEVEGDCETQVDVVTADQLPEAPDGGPDREQALAECLDTVADREEDEGGEPSIDLDATLDSVDVIAEEGDEATVSLRTADPDEPATFEVSVVREAGEWKIRDMTPVTGELAEGSPEDVARDHFQAQIDGDCEALLETVTSEYRESLGDTAEEQLANCEGHSQDASDDRRVGPVDVESQDDEVAHVWVVVFSESYEAGNNSFPVTVVNEDGRWKVDPDAPDWSEND